MCELRGTSWLRRANFGSGAARKMIEEALKLPEDERAEIAGELLVSLDGSGVALGPSSEAVEDRIARRLAEAHRGSVTLLSWEEAQRFIDSDEPDRVSFESIQKRLWSSDLRAAGTGSAIRKLEKRLAWSTRPRWSNHPGPAEVAYLRSRYTATPDAPVSLRDRLPIRIRRSRPDRGGRAPSQGGSVLKKSSHASGSRYRLKHRHRGSG